MSQHINDRFHKVNYNLKIPVPQYKAKTNVLNHDNFRVNSENVLPIQPNIHLNPNIHINPSTLKATGAVFLNSNKLNVFPSECENKQIHYNPRFLEIPNNVPDSADKVTLSRSDTKKINIHVNPTFVQLKTNVVLKDPNLVCNKLSESSVHQETEKIHLNPKFLCSQKDELVVSKTRLEQVTNNLEISTIDVCQGNNSCPVISKKASSSINPFKKVNKHHIKKSLSVPTSKYKWNGLATTQEKMCSNDLYVKPNIFFNSGNQQNYKNRISNSYQKIGKRKLIRKSLLQSYINARRHSIPYRIKHMRKIVSSKQKLYKNRVTTPLKSKYKIVRKDASLFKKVNNVSTKMVNEQVFLKIGKCKMMRKSILASIIEARRTAGRSQLNLSNRKMQSTYHTSKYKFFRKAKETMSPQVKEQPLEKRYTIKKRNVLVNKWVSAVTKSNQMSKSVAYRLRPSFRLRIRMQERKLKAHLLKKVNNKLKCSFYNRFGYCRGKEKGTCKKMHDPKSVTVCRKYLLGECKDSNCKLSHSDSHQKVPTCHQFLDGVCVRKDCPFLHIKLNSTVDICIDFLNGFCSQGDSCAKRHQYLCPDWDKNGTCSKGVSCSYPHPSKPIATRTPSGSSGVRRKRKSITAPIEKVPTDALFRYFDKVDSTSKPINGSDEEESFTDCPEMKRPGQSVYEDEALLSFIPFSSTPFETQES